MQAKTITRIKLSYLLQRIVEFDNSLLLCEFYATIILQVISFSGKRLESFNIVI